MKSNPFLSVIIPAYNEGSNLRFVLNNVIDVLQKMKLYYEIIVVNDGSEDDTSEVAKKFDVRLIDNNKNQGKGSALINGIRSSRGNIIVTMDADGSHRAEDIPNIIFPLLKNDELDATIGSRFVYDIGKKSTSELHLIGNRLINFVILCMTGKFISDSQCGFRGFRKRSLEKMSIYSSGFDIEAEMLIKFMKNGYNVLEIPIVCYPRLNGTTRLRSFKDGFHIIKSIIKISIYSFIS